MEHEIPEETHVGTGRQKANQEVETQDKVPPWLQELAGENEMVTTKRNNSVQYGRQTLFTHSGARSEGSSPHRVSSQGQNSLRLRSSKIIQDSFEERMITTARNERTSSSLSEHNEILPVRMDVGSDNDNTDTVSYLIDRISRLSASQDVEMNRTPFSTRSVSPTGCSEQGLKCGNFSDSGHLQNRLYENAEAQSISKSNTHPTLSTYKGLVNTGTKVTSVGSEDVQKLNTNTELTVSRTLSSISDRVYPSTSEVPREKGTVSSLSDSRILPTLNVKFGPSRGSRQNEEMPFLLETSISSLETQKSTERSKMTLSQNSVSQIYSRKSVSKNSGYTQFASHGSIVKLKAKENQTQIQSKQRNASSSNVGMKNTHSPEKDQAEDLQLEESWSSLRFFNKKQRGRLGTKIEGEQVVPSSEATHGLIEKNLASGDSGIIPVGSVTKHDFIIPELPMGQKLAINIRSTWADHHYVGLNGVELFSSTGKPVTVTEIWADPSDINVLPEYNKDPRVVTNLLDGVNRTRDDMHMWLAPFSPGEDHFIHMCFQHRVKIAMIRVWNYNKSRIHSYRGARDVEISLDGSLIFQGEIARACGGIQGGPDSFGDTILFTTDEQILDLISKNDDSFHTILNEVEHEVEAQQIERPITAHSGNERPFTCAGKAPACNILVKEDKPDILFGAQKLQISLITNWGHPTLIGLTGLEVLGDSGSVIPVETNSLQCSTASPDVYRILDGVNVTTSGEHMWCTQLHESQPIILTVNFPLIVYISGIRLWNYNSSSDFSYCGVRLITIYLDEKLLPLGMNGLIPIRRAPGNCHFNFAQDIMIKTEKHALIDHGSDTLVTDRNYLHAAVPGSVHKQQKYAESEETANQRSSQIELASGSKEVRDEHCIRQRSFSIHGLSRKSLIGTDDYGSFAKFETEPFTSMRNDIAGLSIDSEYEAVAMPQGFVFQLLILSTWGDPYYVGLNGLELFDDTGHNIKLTENNIGAFPDSVNILEGVDNDVRTPEKLVDGVNDTMDGRHMWLAPVLPNQLNRVYIVFDYPVTVSMIKLWNYGKTPSRGVKEFEILVDDLLVYNGILDKASSAPVKKQGASSSTRVPYRTVLFTSNKELLQKEHSTQVKHSMYGSDVQLLNDQQRVTSGGSSICADQSQRPLTSLVPPTRSKSLYNL